MAESAEVAAAVAAALAAERERAAAALAAERERSDAITASLIERLSILERAAGGGGGGGADGGGSASGGAGSGAAPPARRFPAGATSALADCSAPLVISSSPSKTDPFALAAFVSFDCSEKPLDGELRRLSVAHSLGALAPTPPLSEIAIYPLATAAVPSWVSKLTRPADARVGSQLASTLFLDGGARAGRPTIPGVEVEWGCSPELLTKAARFHPAFNGEVKSAMSGGETAARLIKHDELETSLLLGMLASYFRDVPRGTHRFFHAPPRAYGLAAIAHVGYLVAAEWVGKALISVVSQPFFIASPEHAAAIKSLPDADASAGFIDLRVDGVGVDVWPPEGGSRARVLWRTEPPARGADPSADFFWKILRGDGFGAPYFRSVFAVYAALAAARAGADAANDAPPASLVDAELLFGAGQLCVRMPWVSGRDAAPADLRARGAAVAPVAAAVAWLARRGLLYVDLRAPNVRIGDDGSVRLVDYDDCVVLGAPLADAEALRSALRERNAPWAADSPGAFPSVMAALDDVWPRRD